MWAAKCGVDDMTCEPQCRVPPGSSDTPQYLCMLPQPLGLKMEHEIVRDNVADCSRRAEYDNVGHVGLDQVG